MKYEVIGYWGGNRVVVGTFVSQDQAIACWLENGCTSIYCNGRLVNLVRTGKNTYRAGR